MDKLSIGSKKHLFTKIVLFAGLILLVGFPIALILNGTIQNSRIWRGLEYNRINVGAESTPTPSCTITPVPLSCTAADCEVDMISFTEISESQATINWKLIRGGGSQYRVSVGRYDAKAPAGTWCWKQEPSTIGSYSTTTGTGCGGTGAWAVDCTLYSPDGSQRSQCSSDSMGGIPTSTPDPNGTCNATECGVSGLKLSLDTANPANAIHATWNVSAGVPVENYRIGYGIGKLVEGTPQQKAYGSAGNSSSKQKSFTLLEPDTNYEVEIFCRKPALVHWWCSSITGQIKTDPCKSCPPTATVSGTTTPTSTDNSTNTPTPPEEITPTIEHSPEPFLTSTVIPSKIPSLTATSRPSTPTRPPAPTRSVTPSRTQTPSPTLSPTLTPIDSPVPTQTVLTPTPTSIGAPFCDTRCGACGWRDTSGTCHTDGLLGGAQPTSGQNATNTPAQLCCYHICKENQCIAIAGFGGESCTSDTQCLAPTEEPLRTQPATPPIAQATVAPQPKPPVSGDARWTLLLLIPLIILVGGVML